MDKKSTIAKDSKGHLESMVVNVEKSPEGEVEYLKKELGTVLVAGLAEICTRKPANPVEYLGHWLLRSGCNDEGQVTKIGVETRSTQTTPDPQAAEISMSGNPFLIDLVIEMMAEEADVYTLKTLRNMDSIWNQLALKELEKRAMKNELGELDMTEKWFQKDKVLDRFFEATSGIPQLFRSFRLNFPKSVVPIDPIFLKYSPSFLYIVVDDSLQKNYRPVLHKFLIWMAPTVQEIEFTFGEDSPSLQGVTPFSVISSGNMLVFNKLTKLTWNLRDCDTGTFVPFKFFLDKSGNIDPTPNLTTLEMCTHLDFNKILKNRPKLSRWSQLTTLRIRGCGEDDDGSRFMGALLSLGQAGMRLKNLALTLDLDTSFEGPIEICKNLSHFFATQSKTLEVLELDWYFNRYPIDEDDEDEMVEPEIKLPIFVNLHTLHLNMDYDVAPGREVQTLMFRMIQIPVHFPKLNHLHVDQLGFLNMFPLDGEPISLKSLNFHYIWGKPKAWTCNFPSVESLTCNGNLFKAWGRGAELPWKESLKVLELADGVTFPLKLSRFTSLRKLIVREPSLVKKFSVYLGFFRKVLSLKLSSITFKSREEPSDYVKAQYIRHFPFPVKFEPMPTYHN